MCRIDEEYICRSGGKHKKLGNFALNLYHHFSISSILQSWVAFRSARIFFNSALASMDIFSAAHGSLSSSSQWSMTGTVCSSAADRNEVDIGDEIVWSESFRGGGGCISSSSNGFCCSFLMLVDPLLPIFGSSSISSLIESKSSSSCRICKCMNNQKSSNTSAFLVKYYGSKYFFVLKIL